MSDVCYSEKFSFVIVRIIHIVKRTLVQLMQCNEWIIRNGVETELIMM